MAMAIPGECDDIRVDTKYLHRGKTQEHSQRQKPRNQGRAAQVHYHHQNDDNGH